MNQMVLSALLFTTCQQSTVAKEVSICRHLPRGIGKGYNLKEVTAVFAWWVLFPNPPHYLYAGTHGTGKGLYNAEGAQTIEIRKYHRTAAT